MSIAETAIVRSSGNGAVQRASTFAPVRLDVSRFEDLAALGKVCAASGFFADSRQEAQAIVKILAGAEIGVGPIASMTGIYIVKGRITLSANLIADRIRNHPRYDYEVRRLDNDGCELEFTRDGKPLGSSAFTMDDARRAGVAAGDNWKGYARNMLFARAMSNGAKWYCPEVFNGSPVYTPDELGAEVDGETGEVVRTPIEQRVDTRTGEVVDVTSRVTSAMETKGSYAEATGSKLVDVPQDAKALCSALAKELGWNDKHKTRFSQAIGREIAALGSLTDADWTELAGILQAGVTAKKKAFGSYSQLCIILSCDPKDRDIRLSLWALALGREEVASGSDLTVSDWQRLGDALEARIQAERDQQAADANADPFEE